MDLERIARKQSNNRLTAQLLSIGFVLELGANSPHTWKCCEFMSYNTTVTLTEAIVLSDGVSKVIIKGQNGTLEMLGKKNNTVQHEESYFYPVSQLL